MTELERDIVFLKGLLRVDRWKRFAAFLAGVATAMLVNYLTKN
jgi:hypothetical protein